MVNILLSVLEVLSLVGALIFSLLTILTLNKTPKPDDRMFFFLLGSGSSLALFSALCRVVRSLL
jgi:3-hydroxy-3-methylglutaryl CoA synthase